MKRASGIRAKDVALGEGRLAEKGKFVVIQYECCLNRGDEVDRSRSHQFQIGKREEYVGLEQGVLGMREGGLRVIRVGPHLAYRERRHFPEIPEDAVLVYRVELLQVGDSQLPSPDELRRAARQRVSDAVPIADLRRATDAGIDERAAAFDTLSRRTDDEALELLEELMRAKDPRCRGAAARVVMNHPKASHALPILRELLSDPVAHVVTNAIDDLEMLEDAASRSRILDLTGSGEHTVREAAFRFVANMWWDEAYPIMLARFDRERDKAARNNAAAALVMGANSTNWSDIYRRLEEAGPTRHRVWACELVGEFGDESYATDLAALCEDENHHVRKAAKEVLRLLRGETRSEGDCH